MMAIDGADSNDARHDGGTIDVEEHGEDAAKVFRPPAGTAPPSGSSAPCSGSST